MKDRLELMVLLAAVVAGCGADRSAPAPIPAASTAASAAVQVGPPAFDRQVPRVLDDDFLEGKPHGVLVDGASAWLDRGRTLRTTKARFPIGRDVIVGEVDEASDTPLFTIICNRPPFRILLFVDRAAFETVIITPTMLFTQPEDVAPESGKVSRASLGMGLVVSRDSSKSTSEGVAFISSAQHGLRVQGFVAESSLGSAFKPGPGVEHAALLDHHEFVTLVPGTPLFAGPREDAFELARFEVPRLVLTLRLGPTRGRFTEVSASTFGAVVAGWVPAESVGPHNPGAWSGIPIRVHPTGIALEQGTLLVAPGGSAPLGVLTSGHRFDCVSACDSREPMVIVDTCAGAAELRAVRPLLDTVTGG